MPIVRASSWSMTLLLSISPACRLTVGIVVVFPLLTVAEPSTLRNPLALATTLYVPGETVKANVPSGFAETVAANVLSALYRLTVTALEAFTCPVIIPNGKGVDVADATGVEVNVGAGVAVSVGDVMGVAVKVGDSTGPGVCEAPGVEVGDSASHAKVPAI